MVSNNTMTKDAFEDIVCILQQEELKNQKKSIRVDCSCYNEARGKNDGRKCSIKGLEASFLELLWVSWQQPRLITQYMRISHNIYGVQQYCTWHCIFVGHHIYVDFILSLDLFGLSCHANDLHKWAFHLQNAFACMACYLQI